MHLIPASPDSWFFIALGLCQHAEKMKVNILPKGLHRWHTTKHQQNSNYNGFTFIWEYFWLIELLKRRLDILLWLHFYIVCNLYSTQGLKF